MNFLFFTGPSRESQQKSLLCMADGDSGPAVGFAGPRENISFGAPL